MLGGEIACDFDSAILIRTTAERRLDGAASPSAARASASGGAAAP